MTFVTHHGNLGNQEEDLLTFFKSIDKDKDQRWNIEEFKQGNLILFLAFIENRIQISNEELHEIFDRLDINKNGTIGYTEYLAGAADLCILNDERYIKEAFKFFDKDNKGMLTKDQIRNSLNKGWISEKNLIELFNEVDIDKDEKISFEEFRKMMKEMATKKRSNKTESSLSS